MSSENIFLDDWYACLQAHLGYVVAKHDRSNEASLVVVLKRIGVEDEAIEQVRIQTLMALGREAELLPPVEVVPERENNSELEATSEVSALTDAAKEEVSEPPLPEVDVALPSEVPTEPPRKPDPPPKPPKHS